MNEAATEPTATKGPLQGVLVLDMTRVLAGPFCTMLLADLGARVIKIERPDTGDDARHFGPFQGGRSAYFMSLNRGKESIALNLKEDADRAIFASLLKKADVLVENFRPGTMEKLGWGWSHLHKHYPQLVYAAISGFGQTGPYAQRPAYDLVVQGMGGLMSITGHPQSPPTRVGSSMGDITAALFAANGIIAALYHRAQSGKGMQVDIGMLDCQVAILENAIARYHTTQESPTPLGARHPSITPFDAFQTKDEHIIIAAGNDGLFEILCHTLKREDLLTQTHFQDNPSRTRHQAALKQALEQTLQTQPAKVWLQRLQEAGVPCGPIQSIADVVKDPQVTSRNMLVMATDPQAGEVQMAGNPIKLSAFPDPPTRRPAPTLDQDGDEIKASLK